jgi:hypothetical protein
MSLACRYGVDDPSEAVLPSLLALAIRKALSEAAQPEKKTDLTKSIEAEVKAKLEKDRSAVRPQ